MGGKCVREACYQRACTFPTPLLKVRAQKGLLAEDSRRHHTVTLTHKANHELRGIKTPDILHLVLL